MSEFESYQRSKEKPISKAVKYGLLFAVAVGGIGIALNLVPELIAEAEKKLAIDFAAPGKFVSST